MPRAFVSLIVTLIALIAAAPTASAQTAAARAIFDSYQLREQSFDTSVADLYCNTALIRNTRNYPGGERRTIEIPAPQYKVLIRRLMPIARARGDYSTYSGAKYVQAGESVRVTTTRYSVLKKYSSPMTLLIGSCDGDQWGILEEISESQP